MPQPIRLRHNRSRILLEGAMTPSSLEATQVPERLLRRWKASRSFGARARVVTREQTARRCLRLSLHPRAHNPTLTITTARQRLQASATRNWRQMCSTHLHTYVRDELGIDAQCRRKQCAAANFNCALPERSTIVAARIQLTQCTSQANALSMPTAFS